MKNGSFSDQLASAFQRPARQSQRLTQNPNRVETKNSENYHQSQRQERSGHDNGVYEYFRKLPVPGKWRGDGQDHINISVSGATELGCTLHPNTMLPFKHDTFGNFNSLSAFWGYLETGASNDRIRHLHPNARLRLIAESTRYTIENMAFFIADANWQRIKLYPALQEAIIESTLPFDTYSFDGEYRVPRRRGNAGWLIEGNEIIRQALKDGVEPDFKVFMSGKTREELISGYVKQFLGNSNNFVERKENAPNMLLNSLLQTSTPARKRKKTVEVPLTPVTEASPLQALEETIQGLEAVIEDASVLLNNVENLTQGIQTDEDQANVIVESSEEGTLAPEDQENEIFISDHNEEQPVVETTQQESQVVAEVVSEPSSDLTESIEGSSS